MKVLVLVALCLAAVVSANVQKPHAVPMRDIPILPGQKIVGGMETTPHQYKHQVALYINDFFSCGGSIIRKRWVLTAAHCAESAATAYRIVAGAHNRLENEPTQQSRGVTKIIKHPDWNTNTLANDVALMEVDADWEWDDYVMPGTLASARPDVGTIVTPSGWGKTSDAGTVSDVLMHVDVPVMSKAQCQAAYGDIITDTIVCIDGAGGMSTCNGDSGGPLNYADTILGVVSFGSSAGCARNYPAGFSDCSQFKAWIDENIPAPE